MAEIDHGEVPNLAQPVGASEEADAEHPGLEASHQKREVLVAATKSSTEGESDPVEGSHNTKTPTTTAASLGSNSTSRNDVNKTAVSAMFTTSLRRSPTVLSR